MDANAKYTLRWRGRQLGPFTQAEIERKLATREIGMLHEVYSDGRWMSLQEASGQWQQFNPVSPAAATAPVPPETPVAKEPPPAGRRVTSGSQTSYEIQWRGKSLGSMSMAEIERRLDRQELGMLHEVQLDGQWITLDEFFVRQIQVMARTQVQASARSEVRPKGAKLGGRMVLENVEREVAANVKILREINLVIEPNEFVALLGPSGSGKSTLMNVMTGRQRATGGTITLNGENLYKNSSKFQGQIGHVPQKDIVHLPLSVQQELTFAARLRLPSSTPSQVLNERVETVIEQIGLQERKQTKNLSLSGGQLKRVSLGVEILSDPQLLFLDEATSGLDAGIEARMMTLFRRLADDGRTIVCVTHNLDNVCLCDLVAVLVAGRLAYFGPPAELPGYFNVEKLALVYDCLEGAAPDEWARRFKASPFHEKYVAARLAAQPPVTSNVLTPVCAKPNGAIHQFIVLTQRYVSVAFQDYKNIIILLIQAPIIAGLIGLVFHSESFETAPKGLHNQQTLSFLLVISAIWFGCINAAREIVKELPLFKREQAIGLNLASYLGSKIAVLGFFCSMQCVALLAIALATTDFRPDAGIQLGCLLLTSLGGMMMGLLVSSLMKNEDKAVGLVPILLIPQVVFGNAMLKLTGTAIKIAKVAVLSFWALDAMLHTLSGPAQDAFPPVTRLRYDLIYVGIFLFVLTAATVLVLKVKRNSP